MVDTCIILIFRLVVLVVRLQVLALLTVSFLQLFVELFVQLFYAALYAALCAAANETAYIYIFVLQVIILNQ